MGFFIGGLTFFVIMILTLVFTIFIYIQLVMAVKNNRSVPNWMYKIGHAIKGRERDIYRDFTDQLALNEVNFYIVGVILASIVAYFVFYDRDLIDDKIIFWLKTEFLIVVAMRIIMYLGKVPLSFILPATIKSKYSCDFSAATNAIIGMFMMLAFVCILTLTMTGLPERAPVVQVGEYKIVVGETTGKDLLSNGFSFIANPANTEKTANVEKKAKDMIVNKRNSHFYFGETLEIVKDGKGYGYVNLTPIYKDKDRLEDCIVTYFGITSKSKSFDDVRIEDRYISQLSLDHFKDDNMRDMFSLSPISYEELKGKEWFSLRMQTYPYMLWKRYTIEATFSSKDNSSQFEVYTQHTLWE